MQAPVCCVEGQICLSLHLDPAPSSTQLGELTSLSVPQPLDSLPSPHPHRCNCSVKSQLLQGSERGPGEHTAFGWSSAVILQGAGVETGNMWQFPLPTLPSPTPHCPQPVLAVCLLEQNPGVRELDFLCILPVKK